MLRLLSQSVFFTSLWSTCANASNVSFLSWGLFVNSYLSCVSNLIGVKHLVNCSVILFKSLASSTVLRFQCVEITCFLQFGCLGVAYIPLFPFFSWCWCCKYLLKLYCHKLNCHFTHLCNVDRFWRRRKCRLCCCGWYSICFTCRYGFLFDRNLLVLLSNIKSFD